MGSTCHYRISFQLRARWMHMHTKSLLKKKHQQLSSLFFFKYIWGHTSFVSAKSWIKPHLVPKKKKSQDWWPGVLMSAWVLPLSKQKFMPKSHMCAKSIPFRAHRRSTWEKTQIAIKALSLGGQRLIPDLAIHILHCFTFISWYTSQQPQKEWKDNFADHCRAQILWQQDTKRS